MLKYELDNYKNMLVAGLDEVGRGPLAGPVFVAAVIMPQENMIPEINDSKKLSEKKREMLYDKIIDSAIAYSIESVDVDVIDKINILNAVKLAMKNAVNNLNVTPQVVLVDALKIDTHLPQVNIVKGDTISYNIAAASIIAKVARDRYMVAMSSVYPQYNFHKHKGYGTKEHIELLKKHGKCALHRNTFIKNFVS